LNNFSLQASSSSFFVSWFSWVDKFPLVVQAVPVQPFLARYGVLLVVCNEVHLGNGTISKGYFDDRIYQFSQRVYPGCDIGLFTFAGEFGNISSHGLIKPHRDHGYAELTAVIVNLGEGVK
jgi:hypothetical protein